MTELERINKVISDLYDIRDVALSVFGDEGYFALDDSIRSLTKTWNICKKGQEERLKNTYHTPVNNSKKPIKSTYDNEIYRQAFGALLEDYAPSEDLPGGYRVLVDGNYETEFSAESREEAIQKFKDYFANKKKGINNSRKPIKSSFDVLYDYIDKGVFWEDVEDYADQLIQEGKFTLDEYNREKGKLREYFNNEEKKAKKTSWENEGRENGFLNNSKKSIKSDYHDYEDESAWTKDAEERLRAQYADENGLDLNEDIIDEDDYNEWIHKGAAMYSSTNRISPTRNQSSLNKIFS